MATLLRRPQFVEDLREVWRFIARDDETQADKFVFELEKRYRMLAENPALGTARFPKYPAMRIFPYRSYLIIYTPLQDQAGIELIRLLHSARDYHRYFDD
ncbi:type II toxin-antitoxin system RelE/ParE family toxin [Rhizobium wenxiniae]|uniref:type II toxin-antitoxin system RelE/ParE family toxin n=1 Tax=Rhizobium wenxiniae TaxID=1737357 RepID=UPI001C6E1FE6|nr:type II toxin-antitoxin system RelE/ParE family toxin [Rhizobium wenxiniae]MBW9087519.1 type II toxin-antitoxin system RelE/ParE family toxin [Rhizobium wenxiniae]